MYFAQGIAEPSAGPITQPLQSSLERRGFTSDQVGLFWAVIGIPWWLKPVYGMLTDFVPLAGSHRRLYLLLATLLTMGGYVAILALGGDAYRAGVAQPLTWLLVVVALGITLADVVIDAVMVQEGQPLGITGQLQSVQWSASYAASIAGGALGGYLSGGERLSIGLWICVGAMAPIVVLTLLAVREPPPRETVETFGGAVRALGTAARSRLVLGVGAFLLLFNFNPFSTAVLQEYSTGALGLDEQTYGNTQSVMYAGNLLGCMLYGLVARRLSLGVLLHGSIALGVASTLAYVWMRDETSAYVVNAGIGVTYALATMVQFDLAARACPLAAAGTTFALLMALSNISTSLSTWAGGLLYTPLAIKFDAHFAFDATVLLGCAFTATCWLLVPFLKRNFAASFA